MIVGVPDKQWFYVTEAAGLLAREIGISRHAARIRIYRAIESGRVCASAFVGVLKIERREVEKILNGEVQ